MSEERYDFYFIGEELEFPDQEDKIKKLLENSGNVVYVVFHKSCFDYYYRAWELNLKRFALLQDAYRSQGYLDDVRFIYADQVLLEGDLPLDLTGFNGKKFFHFVCDHYSGLTTNLKFKEFLKKISQKTY